MNGAGSPATSDGISQRLVGPDLSAGRGGPAPSTPAAEPAAEMERRAIWWTSPLAEARSAISGLRPPVLGDLGLARG